MTVVLQINLHHSRVSKGTLCQNILADAAGVSLNQEPRTVEAECCEWAPQKAGRKINTLNISNLCSRDCLVSEVYIRVGDGNVRILLVSMYMLYDSLETPPSIEMRWVVEYGAREKKHVIVGCNAHNNAWGITDTNYRGEDFLNFIAEANLVKLNMAASRPFSNQREEEPERSLGHYSEERFCGHQGWRNGRFWVTTQHRTITTSCSLWGRPV